MSEPSMPSAVTAKKIRRIVLDQSKRANVGHIGSCLCVAEILAALYGDVLKELNPEDPYRDRFVLSKGHAALALYAALHLRGFITAEELNTFCTDGTILSYHPEKHIRGIDFSTGSLGQGLTYAAGSALASSLQRRRWKSIVLISDAECNEGSVWEAAMFAAHRKLDNLIAIIDANGQQAFGYTKDVLDLSPLSRRWEAFGWDVSEVDGHSATDIAAAIRKFDANVGKPHVLIAHTVFGKGVSYMEGLISWHYLPMSDEQYQTAVTELENSQA